MSKFQVIHESSPKRCEICHCNDMFDPKMEVCGRCDGWDTGYQPACAFSDYRTNNTIEQGTPLGNSSEASLPSDGEFSFDMFFRASIALMSILCFLVLLAYLRFFPYTPDTLYVLAALLLGLTPGVLAIIIPNSGENITLFDKFMFSVSCLFIFMMIACMSFSQLNNFVVRDTHPALLFVIPLFTVSLFFGFVYESIFRIRKTISRFEVPILSTVASSPFIPLLENLAVQSANGMISIPSKPLALVTIVVFFFFNYFLIDKLWEKTKIR